VTLIGMIIHGHGDEAFVQYSNELWPNDLNFIIELLMRLFHILEKKPIKESQVLFEFGPKRHSSNKIYKEVPVA